MTYTKTKTLLEVGKIYQFVIDRTLLRTSPDISPLKEETEVFDPNEEVNYMAEVLQYQKSNRIEAKTGQVILAIENEKPPPYYIGEKYGKWGRDYFIDGTLGAIVLFEDKECWFPESDFCHLQRV